MSVEGLLCEVKIFKPKHLTVALRDQLYFGGQRIYSDFKPTTSTSNNKKEGKNDGKTSGKKDPLNEAINNAENIANKALSGKGDNKYMDKVSTLEKKVESLTAELENMKVLYQQLVDEVEACTAGKVCQKSTTEPKEEAKKEEKDDDFDLFGSDDEEEDCRRTP